MDRARAVAGQERRDPASRSGGGDQRQFQLQYSFNASTTQSSGQPAGQANQQALGHTVTGQYNVPHHDNGAAGREDSYGVSFGLDASGHTTGISVGVQEALVTATRHHLQGQISASAQGGIGQSPSGAVVPNVGIGVGAQANLVVNDTITVFAAVQGNGNMFMDPARGVTVSGQGQASVGVTITFP